MLRFEYVSRLRIEYASRDELGNALVEPDVVVDGVRLSKTLLLHLVAEIESRAGAGRG